MRRNMFINRIISIVKKLPGFKNNLKKNTFDRNFRMFLYNLTWLKPINGTLIPRIFQLQSFARVYRELRNNTQIKNEE